LRTHQFCGIETKAIGEDQLNILDITDVNARIPLFHISTIVIGLLIAVGLEISS
jgi:hypothetical protein